MEEVEVTTGASSESTRQSNSTDCSAMRMRLKEVAHDAKTRRGDEVP